MGAQLRPYQEAARDAILDQWAGGQRRTLLVLPTGTGKTVVFASVIESVVAGGERCLVLAHRGELLDQAAEKIRAVTGMECAVERAGEHSLGTRNFVTVGSVQTLMNARRLAKFPADRFGAIVVDEAHHALSDSYQRVLGHFPDAKVLGVTATPDRADRRNLGSFFDSLAFEYSMPEAVRDGWLCPIEAQTVPLGIDITGVKESAGDFSANDLGSRLDPYLERIADEMRKAGLKGRRTVVFLPLVSTAKKFRDVLSEAGFDAAEVDGNSDDRAEVLADFAEGRYDVLCNSMLLTEGWDCPPVDCIVVLRPTRSRALYAQMVGRGTRLSPETGKERLLLLDFLWMTDRHDLCRPAHLVAKSPEQAQAMTKALAEAGGALDIAECAERAETDVMRQREEKLATELAACRAKRAKLVDPLQFEMSIAAQDLSCYVPDIGWEATPVTERQRAALERYGIATDSIECAGKASLLLDRLSKRRMAGLSTPKQIRYLERVGFLRVGTWSFKDASSMMDRLSANRWRVPRGVDPATYAPPSLMRGNPQAAA